MADQSAQPEPAGRIVRFEDRGEHVIATDDKGRMSSRLPELRLATAAEPGHVATSGRRLSTASRFAVPRSCRAARRGGGRRFLPWRRSPPAPCAAPPSPSRSLRGGRGHGPSRLRLRLLRYWASRTSLALARMRALSLGRSLRMPLWTWALGQELAGSGAIDGHQHFFEQAGTLERLRDPPRHLIGHRSTGSLRRFPDLPVQQFGDATADHGGPSPLLRRFPITQALLCPRAGPPGPPSVRFRGVGAAWCRLSRFGAWAAPAAYMALTRRERRWGYFRLPDYSPMISRP